ncbi:MAG: hypothetical protein KGI60_02275 [Patescibacteria group bacterium]|nr:hypothetical protein [Patescibacteria group bacterium]
MNDTQLTLREVLGPLTDFFTKLLSKDGPQWLVAFKRFLRKENPWAEKASVLLLETIGTIKVGAIDRFFGGGAFTARSTEVKFAWIAQSFKQRFHKKLEEPQREVELRVSRLKKRSLDESIREELGDKAETTLATIWVLLRRQPNGGKEGMLLANGFANIFYVRDADRDFTAVRIVWSADGWRLHAFLVGSLTDGWDEDGRVFSRA